MQNESPKPNNSKRLVLVVNNQNNRYSVVANLLQQANYQVTEVSIDTIALTLAVEQPDLIILDLNLPNSEGIEICRILKKDPSTCLISILYLVDAELVRTQEQIQSLDNQADGYLVHPINPLELITSVRTLLRIRSSEQKVRESEERFRFMADSSPVLLRMSGLDSLCNFFNKTWLNFTGRTLEEELGNGWAEGVHPEDFQRCLDTYLNAFESQKVFEMDYRLKRADGSYRWLLDRGVPRFTWDGDFVGYIGSCIDITERKEVEKALHKSQAILNAINQSTPTAIFIKDQQGRLIMANPSTISIIGKPESEIIGWRDIDFYSNKSEGEQIMENDRRVMETGQVIIIEEIVSSPEGKRTFLSTKAPYKDQKGNIIGIIGVATDITEYKQTKQALYESEEQLRIALEVSQLGMWHWDLKSDTLTWTEQCKAVFGLPSNTEMSYQVFLEALHLEDRARTHQAVTECLQNGVEYDIEYRVPWSDGTVRWIAAKGNCKHDSTKQLVYMMGVALDITKRKEIELALTISEELFRTTFEKAPVGVTNTDLQGQWLQVNQKFCDIVNYTGEELLGMTSKQITHPDDLENELSLQNELLAGEISNYSLEKRYICKGGFPVWVNISVSLLREVPHQIDSASANLLGKPKYFISVIEDISERKEIEFELYTQKKQLKQVNKSLRETTELLKKRNQELDSFAYIVSHDLKAPLRAIANLCQWLEDELDDQLNQENRRLMELLRQRVYRMEALINGLLEYSRADRTSKEAEIVDVGELLDEIIDSLAPPGTFMIHVQPNMPKIITKRVLLGQVFANLLNNAIKHHERPDGRIEISFLKKGNIYKFSVSDDGPGIAPIHHEKIFGIFQTLKSRDEQENTGIGLSIVKKIIETEGGEITLESELGKGATFSFTWLPQQN